MSRNSPLGKKELNERFTAPSIRRLPSRRRCRSASTRSPRRGSWPGRRRRSASSKLRVLELGASACLFAIAFVEVFSRLVAARRRERGGDRLHGGRVLARRARGGVPRRRRPRLRAPRRPPEARRPSRRSPACAGPGAADTELSLVHAEANSFVDETEEPYDVVILNELLDDLPCRVFWADGEGATHELAPYAQPDGPGVEGGADRDRRARPRTAAGHADLDLGGVAATSSRAWSSVFPAAA